MKTAEFKTDTFHDVEKMLWQHVWKFQQKNGDLYGTKDELFSEACVAFVKAYDSYNPNKGAFTTHVYWKLASAFMTLKRSGTRQALKAPEPLVKEPTDNPGRIEALFRELSEDAKIVCKLLLDGPAGLSALLEDEPSPFAVRLTLREYLDGLGWKRDRINVAFSEIRENL